MTSRSYSETKFSKVSHAPVYMPTAEEFRDPIRYVTQIRPEAEKYGIIKIIPPANFDPPFCINPEEFMFSPRIQRLHEIDALAREKLFFKSQIGRFWKFQGFKYKTPKIDKQTVDEYDLYEAAYEFCERLWNSDRSWGMVAKKLGFPPTKHAELQKIYTSYIKPYEEFYKRYLISKDEIVVLEDVKRERKTKVRKLESMQGVRKLPKRKKKLTGDVGMPWERPTPSSELDSQSETDYDLKNEMQAKYRSEHVFVPGSERESDSESRPSPRAAPRSEPRPEQRRGSTRGSSPGSSPGSRSGSRPGSRSGSRPGSRSESREELRVESRSDPNAEPILESTPEQRPDARPEQNSESNPESKPETRTEPSSEPCPEPSPSPSLDSNGDPILHSKPKPTNSRLRARKPVIKKAMEAKKKWRPCDTCGAIDKKDERDMKCNRCKKIEHHACRVIPLLEKPEGAWNCYRCVLSLMYQNTSGYGFYDSDTLFTLENFTDYANHFKRLLFRKELKEISVGEVERLFWNYILRADTCNDIKYGADLITSKVGSGFPKKSTEGLSRSEQQYINHGWNLNNMPVLENSVFSNMKTHISGMMVPWVYVGMCFSTFCWHTEDHWTYSVNYNHWGEPKVWYGVPGDQAEKFEKVVSEVAPHTTAFQKDVFHYMATAFNPTYLKEHGVDVYTVHQHAREFVVTFPRAYHSGFNCGVNFAEAVNFAPYDWLPFGRKSMNNYAKVRRPSVFSYDELMIRASQRPETMGIEMAEYINEQLKIVGKTMEGLETKANSLRVRTVLRKDFLDIPEEHRACRYCKAVCCSMFVQCEHKRVTCINHAFHLCDVCLPHQIVVNKWKGDYLHHVERFKARLKVLRSWISNLEIAYSRTPKPALSRYQHLAAQGEHLKCQQNEKFIKLKKDIKSYSELIELAESLMTDKMRTRQETRAQRADTRATAKQIENLFKKMEEAPCDFGILFSKVKARHEAVVSWQESVAKAIEMFQTNINTPNLQLESIISRGESFDLRLSELEELKKCSRILEWKKKVEQLTSWRCLINMEDEENFLSKPRHELSKVSSLIKEGTEATKRFALEDMISDLNAKYSTATLMEEEVASLRTVKDLSMDQLDQAWKRCRESDWCNAPAIDWLRKEYIQARAYCKEGDVQELSLTEVYKHVEKCQKSSVLSSTTFYKDRLVLKNSGDLFTEKLALLFMRPASYYTLIEILNEREDLIPLVEGRNVPMRMHKFSEPLDEWEAMESFDKFSEVQKNFDFLREQRRKLLGTLIQLNDKKLVSQTCACLSVKEDGVICCLLCKSKNHVSCCRWDSFLGNLPEGAYLCVRCLRSSRPSIKEVNQVCQFAHEKSMEGELVRVLAHAAKENSLKVKSTANTMLRSKAKNWQEEFKERALMVVEDFLSLEISEPNVMKDLAILIKFLFKDILEKQKGLCAKLRITKWTAPKVLFAEPRVRGRRSDNLDEPIGRKRFRSNQHHEDREICAFEACVRPSVKRVGWVQCEDCGCWYHLVCVGLTLEAVNAIEIYKCSTC